MEAPKNAKSVIWKLVSLDRNDHRYVRCQVEGCESPKVDRCGDSKAKHTTMNILRHLDKLHPRELKEAQIKHKEEKEREAAKKPKPVSTFFKKDRQSQYKQQTVEESIVKHWDINDHQSKALHYKIGEMIALDNQPFSIVEDIGFTRLMGYCKPKFKLPSRHYMTNEIIPKIYKEATGHIKIC